MQMYLRVTGITFYTQRHTHTVEGKEIKQPQVKFSSGEEKQGKEY